LKNAFVEIGQAFEKDNPGARVLFNFGASGALLQQIAKGAPADVLATADTDTMDRAQSQELLVAGTRRDFARNRLVLALPASARLSMSGLNDLQSPAVSRIGIGTPDSVPAGRYAKEALDSAGLWHALTRKYVFGQNVRQVLDYVARGEVDAGFVYATDAEASKDKVKIAFEVALDQRVLYPIAVVAGTRQRRLAESFLAYVQSQSGTRVLEKYGFLQP
jgi:molybdate transport system substrate-binding protein